MDFFRIQSRKYLAEIVMQLIFCAKDENYSRWYFTARDQLHHTIKNAVLLSIDKTKVEKIISANKHKKATIT